MSMDQSEKRITLFALLFSILLALVALFMAYRGHTTHAVKAANITDTVVILVGGLILFVFSRAAKRVGVIVTALLLALYLGALAVGMPYFALALWLMMRAWRLQKYGQATYAGSIASARARAVARKEGKEWKPGDTAETPREQAIAPRTPPKPSKRYTPKQTPRKKR